MPIFRSSFHPELQQYSEPELQQYSRIMSLQVENPDERVMQYMQHALDFDRVGMGSTEAVEVYKYLKFALENSYFTKSYMFTLPGTNLTYLAVSTAASTQQMQANVFENSINAPVRVPSWTKYAVWEYRDLSIMNFHGVTQSLYQGYRLQEDLGAWIRSQHTRLGKVFMQTPIVGGIDHDSLRVAFATLGIPFWLEITVGHSLLAFCGLDVYVKILAPGAPPPREEAWYLMNATWHPSIKDRPYVPPDQWYICADMVCWGQRSSLDNMEYRSVHPLQARCMVHQNQKMVRARF